ncbi:hypothetical protein FRB96_002548 [Tulasnella sp. 330]|nr:hypothetical protein FRB96_002548 [Tulasnella sp. 330]
MEALAARDALGLDHWSHSVAPSTHTVPSGAMEVDVTLLSGRPLGALVDAPLLAILNPIPGAVTDDDMEEFASALRFNRISGFAEIEQTFTRAETIWYIVLDRCLQLRVKWFALTNGAQWCFGVFGKGYRAGYVFPPISHCVNRSIIPQYLALWSKSAIRDGWLDPDLFNLRPIELATSNERDEISNGVWRGPYSRETSPEADPDELRARILQDSSRPEMQAWLKEATEIQVQHVDLKGRGVVQTNSQDSRFAPTEIQMPQASILAGSADGHGRRGCRHESDRLKCYDRILDGGAPRMMASSCFPDVMVAGYKTNASLSSFALRP